MDQNIATLVIVVGVLIAYSGLVVLAKKLKAKKVDAESVLEKVETGLDYAQTIATAIDPFLPKIAGTVITKTLTAAQKAVVRAEATYKAANSTDPKAADNRKAEATSLVKSALALDGIQDTPDVDKLINAVIPVLVLALPKTHTDAADTSAAAIPTPVKAG